MVQAGRITEIIKFYTEMLKVLSMVLIATLGGTVTLIVSGSINGSKSVLIGFGLIFSAFMFAIIYRLYRTTKSKIDGLP